MFFIILTAYSDEEKYKEKGNLIGIKIAADIGQPLCILFVILHLPESTSEHFPNAFYSEAPHKTKGSKGQQND